MKTLLTVSIGAVAMVALLSSCHSNSGLNHDGETDGGGDGSAVLCPASEEPPARQVTVVGGVPFDQFPNALAVARCNYVSRCFALANYVANDCVDTVVGTGTYTYQTCTKDGTNARCSRSTTFYNLGPFDQLVQKVSAGEARYDAQRAGECIAALLAEPCVTRQLIEGLASCTGVISCLADAGSGAPGSSDGGATDAGLSCAALVDKQAPFPTCSTADQCVGVANPPWSYCVGGLCAPSPCGFFATCTALAQAGQPCETTAPSILTTGVVMSSTGTCAPGLTCQRTNVDAGTGTCIAPHDVGGACAAGSDCKPGLACACGACEIPPTSGPCADGLCRVDMAYCEYASGQCKPVRKLNDSCSDAINSCGPGLVCAPPAGLCQVPTL